MQKNRQTGALTVEAALVLPLLLCFFMVFLYFFQIIFVREKINIGLQETAKEISKYSYVYEQMSDQQNSGEEEEEEEENGEEEGKKQEKKLKKEDAHRQVCQGKSKEWVQGLLTRQRMEQYVAPALLNRVCVKNGAGGMQYDTKVFEEEKEIAVTAQYAISMPIFGLVVPDIPMIQKVKTRGFVGTEEIGPEEEEPELVYITQYGTVYHRSLDCSHLRLTIQSITFSEVGSMRNQNGAKYYACEHCADGVYLEADQTVYITTDGNRYHSKITCSGLSRYIQQKSLSQLEGYDACLRCGDM